MASSSRSAGLVDARYLLGVAATVVAGDANRALITVDYQSLIPALIQEAERQTGLPVLRLLWYEGARESHRDCSGPGPRVVIG